MILYRNIKVKVRSPDGDTEYFDIAAGVLQGMLRAVLNKSWRQHKLYKLDEPDTRDTAGEARTSSYGRAKAGRPARTYIQQLCEDTGCAPEDLPEAMNDKEKWRERVRDIRAGGTT